MYEIGVVFFVILYDGYGGFGEVVCMDFEFGVFIVGKDGECCIIGVGVDFKYYLGVCVFFGYFGKDGEFLLKLFVVFEEVGCVVFVE